MKVKQQNAQVFLMQHIPYGLPTSITEMVELGEVGWTEQEIRDAVADLESRELIHRMQGHEVPCYIITKKGVEFLRSTEAGR